MKVLQFPLARITFWFIAGIVWADHCGARMLPVFVCLLTTTLLALAAWYRAQNDLVQKPYFGMTGVALAFLLGATTSILHSGAFDLNHYLYKLDDSKATHKTTLVLRERLKSTPARQRYVADVIGLDGQSCNGKILVHLDRVDFAEMLPIGTVLKVESGIAKHGKPKNPDQFDYGAYLAQKSILAQLFADGDYAKIGRYPVKDIFYYSDKIRNRIIANLEKSGCSKKELAVIAALLLGQQQEIDPEVLRDYQLAGAVHILSVSGLHVGMVLVLLNFLLRGLPNNRKGSLVKLAIVLLSLWGFAILAGLSPSVVRSVTMFSFMAIGVHLKRKTNIFHTLLVSMLLILVFQPSFVFDVGFQLSYLALFFILWLQPMLSDWWQPQNRIINYFWQILTVSFAAQIGTLPLSIYYFHQFPGLFFVTNLVVIPLLGIIMALGILAMVPATFMLVPELLIKTLETGVWLLNEIIARIAALEQFIFADIALNRWMMIGLYLLFATIILWLQKPNFVKAIAVLASVIIWQTVVITTRWHNESQKEWLVFNTYKSTGIVTRLGTRITPYGNRVFVDGKALQTYVTAHFGSVQQQKTLQNILYFDGHRIMIVDSIGVYPTGVNADVLLLRQSPKINLERLLQTTRPKVVVADASNYKSYVKLWKATCQKNKIPFHATAEMGYFKL